MMQQGVCEENESPTRGNAADTSAEDDVVMSAAGGATGHMDDSTLEAGGLEEEPLSLLSCLQSQVECEPCVHAVHGQDLLERHACDKLHFPVFSKGNRWQSQQ